MARICLVSHPRSGSTSLLRTLAKKAEVSAAYEMFHMNEEVVLEHLKHALSDENIETIKEKSSELGFDSLKEFYQTDSLKYLELIHSLAESDDFIFKIFPYHMKEGENFEKIISSCDLVIFLSRNSLHSCISNQVAIKVGTYANVDTSDVSVEFDEEEFKRWHNHIVDFFEYTEAITKKCNVRYVMVSYESMFLGEALDDKVQSIINLASLNYRESEVNPPVLKKQDTRQLAIEKVKNPSELISFLEREELKNLNAVTTSTPFVYL